MCLGVGGEGGKAAHSSIRACIDTSATPACRAKRRGVSPYSTPCGTPFALYDNSTSGLVAMTSASHAEGRQFDPGLVYFRPSMNGLGLPTQDTPCKMTVNQRKSYEILRGTPYKMDANPRNSNEILRGTPCKMDADPWKTNEIFMVPAGYK
jgi:hypothetical protein